jgi:beta-glucosidase
VAAVAALVVLAGPLPAALAAAEPRPASSGRCGDPVARPWCDLRLTPDQRADLLLGALTLEERISLLGGDELTGVSGRTGEPTGTSRGVERVGLPDVFFSDGPVGPRLGPATGMPSPLNVAASFSSRVAERHAAVVGDEVRNKGADVVFAPAINILRTPVNGRTFEYFGEDPFLAGLMAEHWTKGVQAEGVIGNVKHYAANNQEGIGTSVPGVIIGVGVVGSRLTVNVDVDERTLREIYLPAFEAAVVDGGVGSVMCAYPRVNGSYACESEYLLTEVLKDDFGFQGFVLTDYGAGKNTVASLRNGLDLDIFPGVIYNPAAVRAALAGGQVTEAMIDEHVRRILRTLFAFGFFDRQAYVRDDAAIDQQAHHEEAARIAAEGTVLLKNDGGMLPLAEQGLARWPSSARRPTCSRTAAARPPSTSSSRRRRWRRCARGSAPTGWSSTTAATAPARPPWPRPRTWRWWSSATG